MELNYINFLSISLLSTGLLFCVRIVRKISCKKCKCYPTSQKTVLITGATSGLGEACAIELAKRNCRLILGYRNQQLGERVLNTIQKANVNSAVKMIHLDLSDLGSVKQFAEIVRNENIDVVINNAGVMAGHFRMMPSTKTEEAMAVNYLGHFYLTKLLLPILVARHNVGDVHANLDPPRVIFISSSLSKHGRLDVDQLDLSRDAYNPSQAYANSKLALNMFAKELHERYHRCGLEEKGVNVMTMFTGGMVNTRLSRHVLSTYNILLQPILKICLYLFLKDASDACHPIVHCALSKDLAHSSGELYANFRVIPWPDNTGGPGERFRHLWSKSCKIVGVDEG